MRPAVSAVIASAACLMLSAPVFASDGTELPEPTSVTLISLAMAGVLIGRRMSSKRPRDD